MPTSDAVFAGSIPEHYDRGLGPVIFEPYAIELAASVPKLEAGSILDIACGTGRVTRHLRQNQPAEVRIVGADLSEPMIAFASSQGTANVEWTIADAQDLPFADGEFDAVVCQFGVMFFPDKALALREISRVLKPGGTLVAATWDAMDRVSIIHANHRLLHEVFADDPPKFLDVPFSMTNPDETRKLFSEVFPNVTVERSEKEVPVPDLEAAARGLVQGNPLINQIIERDATAPERLVKQLVTLLGKDPVSRLSAWIVKGKKAA